VGLGAPDEPAGEDDVLAAASDDDLAPSELAAPALVESVLPAPAAPSSAFLAAAFGEAYKSEYQPPPLRMKFVPPLIKRCADACLQLGQSSTGGSVILCTSSHAWPHAPQAYSYVGMTKSVRARLALCQVECQSRSTGALAKSPGPRAPGHRGRSKTRANERRTDEFDLELNGRRAIQVNGGVPVVRSTARGAPEQVTQERSR
jgi:hypothetical protein